MADALHKTTLQFVRSANTPEYDPATWKIYDNANPPTADEARVISSVPRKYWVFAGGVLAEMDASGKATVDAAIAAADAAQADRVADMEQIRTGAAAVLTACQATVDAMDPIIADASFTAAERDAAIKSIATRLRRTALDVDKLVRGMRRLVGG